MQTEATADTGTKAKRSGSEPRWRVAVCFGITVAACYAVLGLRVQPSQWTITPDGNAPMTEALAWQAGRMDLPHEGRDTLRDRMHDTAWIEETGKVYSITPPLPTFFCFAVTTVEKLWLGETSETIGPVIYASAVLVPLFCVGFWAFRTQTRSAAWAGLLTFAWLAATANYPLMVWSQGGNAGFLNQLLAQIGILLIAGDLLGRRRIWPAAIGLVIGAWSRQMTVFYFLPLLGFAWFGQHRRRDLVVVIVAAVIGVGTLMTLNQLKFGSMFETGYGLIYKGRGDDDHLAMRARQGLFSPKWIRDNLAYMVWRRPEITWTNQGLALGQDPDGESLANGASLFFSSPLVLVGLASGVIWWRDRRRCWLMLGTLPVILGILMYHAPGFLSTGCYRFGMDYVPVWL
ncbi:MAG: hypothetical protein O7D94_13260, partial [Planctomycetota bacterium]|nr:hypothetical protein [Planctomycetota bacterium]